MFTQELRFENPTFLPGINTTCRRGIKWSLESHAYVRRGGEMRCVELEPRVMRFCDIQDSDLISEHDPACRNAKGLLFTMKATYLNFNVNEIVTLVNFWLP